MTNYRKRRFEDPSDLSEEEYWAEPNLKTEARILWQEAKELHLIFSKIWRK